MKKEGRIYKIICGPIIFIILKLLCTSTFGEAGACAIATAGWMIAWWVTAPISAGATSLVPIATNAIYGFIPMNVIFGQFSSGGVVLIFGACLLTMTWITTGLDKRLALGALRIVGPNVTRQIGIWFLLATLFSSVLPNTVVIALLAPVAVAMLKFLGHDDFSKSDLAAPILCVITYGACVGGALTPLGGAMNPIAIDIIKTLTGYEITFIDWVTHIAPPVLILGVFLYLGLVFTPRKTKVLEGTKSYFSEQYKELGKMRRDEKISLTLFVIGVTLCFTRPLYASILPSLETGVSLVLLGALGFLINGTDGKPMVTWQYVEKNMMWNMLFLIAGGGTMGYMFIETNVVKVIGGIIGGMNISSSLILIIILVLLAYFIAESSSATAASAICVPIAISACAALELNPVPYLFVVILGFSGNYFMPNARSYPIGVGVPITECFKSGAVLVIINVIMLPIICYLLVQFWPYFSYLPGFAL